MAIPTTTEEQYTRLRSYLSPYLKGPNVDAVLNALASSNAAYLINNVAAVNDQLYIATASGRYLDERLAQYGISRPPAVGLSDDVFSQIGIQVKNRKQVRDLMDKLLDAIFGDEFVRATDSSSAFEPYNLIDGSTLIINFDDANTVTITFSAAEFENIAAAKAQEVADAITKSLRAQGFTGTAIAKDDGNGPYVEILSDTIGPASSVTVLGGSAQNQLQFPAAVPAGGNMSTQWTLSLQPGGLVRFTWSGGANPNIGKVNAGNYVNVFGGGFSASANEGSYTIVTAVGGAVNLSYFEVENPLGTPGIVVQGSDTAVLFYNPVRNTIASKLSYAAIYQTTSNILQVFLPAATKVVRRTRQGSAHLHYAPNVSYTLNAQPNAGDNFTISSAIQIVAATNFAIGADINTTVQNMANALAGFSGIAAYANNNVLNVYQDSLSLTLIGSYSGSANIVPSGPQGDPTSLQPNQQGPYMYDLTQPFTVSSVGTILTQELDGTQPRVFTVQDSSQFPDQIGYFILGYGTENQEGPIPYIARPSNDTLLISPAYTVKNTFQAGTDVALVALKSAAVISQDGLDYPFYITDVVSGRQYAQDLINSVAATGITIVFTILYPSDIGLGKWGTAYTENPIIWGP
jgi:hypothetical protein